MRRRGFEHERDLVRRLWSEGFAVMRAPASGSKVKRTMYPDIVAIMNGRVFVFEVKTSYREKTIYIPRNQVEKIVEFARRANGKAFIAVKIIGSGTWRCIPIGELEETRGGNYRWRSELVRKGLKIRDLVEMVKSCKKIDEYLD